MTTPASSSESFRARENAQRRPELRNDADAHGFLERLNDALEHSTASHDGPETPVRPTVLVLGVPRAGTTLLAQVLTAGLDVGYVDTIAARFWKSPADGMRLSHTLGGGAPRSFESAFGTPDDLHGPHEFSYFWHHWMRRERVDPTTGVQSAGEAVDWEGFARTIARMQAVHDRPLVLKGLLALGHLPAFAQHVPQTVFVLVDRDPVDTALSLLAARRRYYGDEGTWWSLHPREHADLLALSPVEQVAGQVIRLRAEFRAELAEVPAASVVRLTYDDLCAAPNEILGAVRGAMQDVGGNARVRRRLPAFAPRRPVASLERERAVIAAVQRFDPAYVRNDPGVLVPHTQVRISERAAGAAGAAVAQGQLATGAEVRRLEDAVSARLDGAHVVCVSSGMAALEMLLQVAGGPERRVAMPSYVCEALLLSAQRAGCAVDVLDVERDTHNLAPGVRVPDILVVPHHWGAPAPIADMMAPMVVEDLAHALGATIDDVPCGTFGTAAFTSFYATKLVPGAHGGAMITRDVALAEAVRDLRQYNHRTEYRVRYQYPMSDVSAALARAALDDLDADLERRRAIAMRYDAALADTSARPQVVRDGTVTTAYRYVVDVADPMAFIDQTRALGVECKRALPRPLHAILDLDAAAFPASELLGAHTVSLPLAPHLAPEAVDRVIDAVRAALGS